MKTLQITALAALLLAAACRQGGGTADKDEVPSIDSKGPNDLVLQVSTGGGFVPVELNLAALPRFSLYGDGRVITQGPQILIFPGPALPNLLVRHISPEGMTEILSAARNAGLSGPDRNFDQAASFVADAPTTTFTFSTDEGTHQTSAYAIDFLRDLQNLQTADREAVEALLELDRFLTDLEGRLPEGSVSREEAYSPDELRLYVTERTEPQAEGQAEQLPDQEPAQPAMEWALPAPLGEFGEPAHPAGYRCGTVSGPDLGAVLSAAERANQQTPWTSGGKTYSVTFRPLLPDESGC
jgi:hypothetical protein